MSAISGIKDCNHRENHIHSSLRRHAISRTAIYDFFEIVNAPRFTVSAILVLPCLLGMFTGLFFQKCRCQVDGIGWDFLKVKESCGLLTIDLNNQIQWSLSIPFFAWIRIDMVH